MTAVEIFTVAIGLLMSLAILVALHELGHFIPAKLFKTRVEKFYLFFDPWFSLLKFKKGDTEYGIGWVPLGGYVKIAGMIDESMDKEAMKEEPKEWEFRSKKTWQRLIIMLGGVTVNVIVAIIIYWFSLFTWGEDYLPIENAKYGIACDSLMVAHGFEEGDHIIKMGDEKPREISDVVIGIIADDIREITVLRNNKEVIINLPDDIDVLMARRGRSMISARFPFTVESILPNGTASKSDLKVGDKLIAINEKSTVYFSDFKKEIAQYKEKEVLLSLIRNDDTIKISCGVDSMGLIGAGPGILSNYLEFAHQEYSFWESFPAAFDLAINKLSIQVGTIDIAASNPESIGSFGTMAKLFPKSFSNDHYWQIFWDRTAFISLILAFMNLLPIPALDGGHVVFLLYEMIFRRKPNEKFMEYAQVVGMVLLLGLMLMGIGNDFIW